jgi:hypothetical protein
MCVLCVLYIYISRKTRKADGARMQFSSQLFGLFIIKVIRNNTELKDLRREQSSSRRNLDRLSSFFLDLRVYSYIYFSYDIFQDPFSAALRQSSMVQWLHVFLAIAVTFFLYRKFFIIYRSFLIALLLESRQAFTWLLVAESCTHATN